MGTSKPRWAPRASLDIWALESTYPRSGPFPSPIWTTLASTCTFIHPSSYPESLRHAHGASHTPLGFGL